MDERDFNHSRPARQVDQDRPERLALQRLGDDSLFVVDGSTMRRPALRTSSSILTVLNVLRLIECGNVAHHHEEAAQVDCEDTMIFGSVDGMLMVVCFLER